MELEHIFEAITHCIQLGSISQKLMFGTWELRLIKLKQKHKTIYWHLTWMVVFANNFAWMVISLILGFTRGLVKPKKPVKHEPRKKTSTAIAHSLHASQYIHFFFAWWVTPKRNPSRVIFVFFFFWIMIDSSSF